jgi:hypothetical protein
MLDDVEQKRMRIDPEACRDPDLLAAEVRRLQGVISALDEENVYQAQKTVTNYPAKLDGWIPVTEQLPALGAEVVALWDGVPEFASRERDGTWWSFRDETRFCATHWIPLPAPPEDGEPRAYCKTTGKRPIVDMSGGDPAKPDGWIPVTANTQDQEHRMSDETKPQESAAMPPASAGSRANIMDEAREWLARSRAAKSLPSERIIASLLVHATLTDEERDAIWTVAEAYAENGGDPESERIASVMQGLWRRTK